MITDSPPHHGGNILALARARNLPLGELHDFSASINPLGPPSGVATALHRALEEACHYPEQHAGRLVEALAGVHRFQTENLLAGNGSTELIYLLPRVLKPRRAAVVTPAFGEYGRALSLCGVPFDSLALDPAANFPFKAESLLEQLAPDCELLFVANPGNPSGVPIEPKLLLELAQALRGRANLVVDEAFVDFCPEFSLLEHAPRQENLFVLRSLTKFYAIPGLRVGYLAGPAAGVSALRDAQEPWSVGAPALHAALTCLEDLNYRRTTLRQIPRLRRQLVAGMTRLGLKVYPSAANYLLCRLPDGCAAAPLAALLQLQGLLVRTCDDFIPLDGSYLRVAVRGSEANRLLLRHLGAMLPEVRGV